MKEPTEEERKRLREWCGLHYEYYSLSSTLDTGWYHGSKYVSETVLPIDLNYLFKYAVPKLWKAEKVKALLDKGYFTRVVQYPKVKLLPISKGYGDLDYEWNCLLTLYTRYSDSKTYQEKEKDVCNSCK